MTTILLIEDVKDIRENTSEILELAGYNTIPAENGNEGVRMAKQYLPDLIICDILMPDIDGYHVLEQLQNMRSLREIPFIFLTAKSERIDLRKGMEMGADDYVTKPFTGEELLAAVSIRLERAARFHGR